MAGGEDPLVSIILPTWNRLPYLRQAVASVMAQTEPRWELIVADDGSDDGTQEYLTGITDSRVRNQRFSRLGHPGKVRNAAFRHARGRYVAFLDSDDWWEPEKLSLQLTALTRHPEAGWSYTWFRSVDRDGRDLATQYRPSEIHGSIVEALLSGAATVITPSVMVDRSLLETAGGFDEALPVGSHLDLFVRLALRKPVVLIPRILVVRRTHDDNYGRPFRESRPDIERLFARLTAHAPSPRARRLVQARREQWLVDAADRQRVERRFGAAWSSLAAALPGGALSPSWWRGALKALIQPVLPERR